MTVIAPPPAPHVYAALDELAPIRISGADARAFLHGQLTQDIQSLPPGQARLAGYCTAKGRLLATGIVWRVQADDAQADDYLFLVRADLAEALVKRLRMFVLRAKVTIALAPLKVWGLGVTKQADSAPWQVVQGQDGGGRAAWCISAPDGNIQQARQGKQADVQRCWYVADSRHALPDPAQGQWANYWRVCDIQAGLPWVQAATQERFIPQTLNLDLLGGVSFDKGCYPGQEVVARSHYRGTLKRRMAAGVCSAAGDGSWFKPDADIFDARHPDQPWGRVVNIEVEHDTAWLLFEAQLSTLHEADLRLGHPQGPAISLHALPCGINP